MAALKSEVRRESGLSYVDAHLHLADSAFVGRIEQALDNAGQNNVAYLLSNGMDYDTSIQTIALAKLYPGKVLAAIGVHPWTATNSMDCRLERFEQLIQENLDTVKAIGEIGLDGKYTQDEALKSRQKDVFRFFLRLAQQHQLPVVVHSRQAVDETLEVLSEFDLCKVLLHWYDGPSGKLKLIEERGYLISIGPAVFYSRSISEIAQNAALDMILTETDAPVKYTGPFEDRLTQPSFVVEVIDRLAEIKAISTEAMREVVWRNFLELLPSVGR